MREPGGLHATTRRRAAVALVLGSLSTACGARGPNGSQGAGQPPTASPSDQPIAAPPPSETMAVASAAPTVSGPAADATIAAPSGPPPACLPTSKALEPRALLGYVSSRSASERLHGRFEAEIVAVDLGPPQGEVTEWLIKLRRRGQPDADDVNVYAPKTLPPPLVPGQRVTASVQGTGGGPNRRYGLVFQAADGTLLLAVNQPPDGWQAERGKLAGTRPASGYTERKYGVRIEHAGQRVEVAADKWARFEVGGCTYYLWGSAAERQLQPGKSPMPDYVGGWLDFAIVRAR